MAEFEILEERVGRVLANPERPEPDATVVELFKPAGRTAEERRVLAINDVKLRGEGTASDQQGLTFNRKYGTPRSPIAIIREFPGTGAVTAKVGRHWQYDACSGKTSSILNLPWRQK